MEREAGEAAPANIISRNLLPHSSQPASLAPTPMRHSLQPQPVPLTAEALENEIMTAINEGSDARDAAVAWLQENPAILEDWLDGVSAVDGSNGLQTVRAALDI